MTEQTRAKVYIETSLISYLAARRSRDLIVAARQQLTIDWCDKEREKYELFISEAVLREARKGDGNEIAKRWNCKHIANAHVRKMAGRFFREVGHEPAIICTSEELGANS